MPQLHVPVTISACQVDADVHVTTMTYPGTPSNVSAARHRVRHLLRHSPRAYEAELIAAELMSNAIRHTPSGDDGGTFTINVRHGPGWARIEVFDLGDDVWHSVLDDGASADDSPVPSIAECGRGLKMVAAFADDCGHEVSGTQGQACWAVVTW